MFTLIENNILKDFSCRYEDEYHNRIRFAREENGFYAKLKFADEKVSVPVIRVTFPVAVDEKGLKITLNFSDGKDHSADKDVSAAISGTTFLINHWIMMLTDAIAFDINRKTCGEETAKHILKDLAKYEELRPVIRTVI